MSEFHGWFALWGSLDGEREEGVRAHFDELRGRVAELDWSGGFADLRYLNGTPFLVLEGRTDEPGTESLDIQQILAFIVDRLPGSYGLLYERRDDAPTPPGPGGFAVTVLARGRLEPRLDPFLSPVPQVAGER